MTNEKSDTQLTDALGMRIVAARISAEQNGRKTDYALLGELRDEIIRLRAAESAAQPSGASLRCLRCGEKQDVVFKFATESASAQPDGAPEAMRPVPENAPVLRAWNLYKQSADYANTRKWAKHDEHVDGSLWAAFYAGYFACAVAESAQAPIDKASSSYVPLCGRHAASWFTERNHLNGGMESECVVCAHQPSQAPQEQAAKLATSFVQPVPDKCGRIVWRGRYYHFPLQAPVAGEVAKQADSIRRNVELDYKWRTEIANMLESLNAQVEALKKDLQYNINRAENWAATARCNQAEHAAAEQRADRLQAELDALKVDAERLAYLTADHDDVEVRRRRNDLLCRMSVMSHSAACAAIDAARKEGR